MTIREVALVTAKAVFFAHRDGCDKCRKFVLHKTATLQEKCFAGMLLYKSLLNAEYDIVKYEKSKETAKINKAIRRGSFKEMNP